MSVRARCIGFWALVALAGALGCNTGPDGQGVYEPMVFPWEGRLGEGGPGSTIAVLIDSNYAPYDITENYDLHRDRVGVALVDADPATAPNWDPPVEVTPRAVFNVGSPPGSIRSLGSPGTWVTVALFDLPPASSFSFLPSDYPVATRLQVSVDGLPLRTSDFQIIGESGTPNPLHEIFPAGWVSGLEPQRMIRLRLKRGAELNPDAGHGSIGAVEFDFEYDPACVDAVRAYPDTDFVAATAMVGVAAAGETPGWDRVHVVLLDPKGVDLPYLNDSEDPPVIADETVAGQGPILSLAIDGDPACLLSDPGVRAIRNLRVTDVDGVAILDDTGLGDSEARLALFYIEPSGA